MKDDLQIKIAADLADTDAPEKLSGKRAREFVSKTLQQKNTTHKIERKAIPFLVWGGAVTTIAASIMLGVFVFSPNTSHNYGTPSQLMEMQSVHSEISIVDTTVVDSLETSIIIKSIEE